MVDEDRINRIIKEIEAQYGEGTASRGDDEPPLERISTGSLELDYATGGGIAVGRWSRFYGPKSSGKSIKAWHVLANAQKMGYTCAYVNAEKQYTDEFTALQGVDIGNLLLVQSTVIETIGEIMEGKMDEIDFWIIDSCSSTVSRTELKDGLNEKEYYAIRARKWGQQFSFIHERFDSKRNTILFIDQVRTKVGSMYPVLEPPGGKYMEHVSSCTVQFGTGSMLWYDVDGVLQDSKNTKQKTLSGDLEADGIEISAKVVKSRVCRPFRTARMKFDYNTLQFDHIDEYLKAAKYFGVVDASSKGWVQMPGEDKKIRPRELRERIENDPALRESIREAVFNQSRETVN